MLRCEERRIGLSSMRSGYEHPEYEALPLAGAGPALPRPSRRFTNMQTRSRRRHRRGSHAARRFLSPLAQRRFFHLDANQCRKRWRRSSPRRRVAPQTIDSAMNIRRHKKNRSQLLSRRNHPRLESLKEAPTVKFQFIFSKRPRGNRPYITEILSK